MSIPPRRLVLLGCAAWLAGSGPNAPAAEIKVRVPVTMQGFGYDDVRLTDSIFKAGFEANRRYLHSLPTDSLLYMFRKNAGLVAPGDPLGGWEEPECLLRGHFMGHYLSACARTYAVCGDVALKERADGVVAELRKCQQALGGGYLSAYPAMIFDILEGRQQGRTWAPYYTMHKIMVGLLEMHALAGNEQALQTLCDMADYFKGRTDKLSDDAMQRMLRVEYGGMSEVLYDLYAVTGRQRYADLARRFEQQVFLDPLAAGQDNLTGLHANTHIPKVLGAARAYELTGEQRYRDIVKHFWDLVASTRTYATGGSNVGEHWREPNELKKTLADNNEELCTDYNWLKVCRYLLRWTGEAGYGDMYERVLYNGVLGRQDSEGQFEYFLPLRTGSRRTFGTPLASFWCCYGTGVQQFASFGNSVYFHDGEGLYVSLFIPSEVTWRRDGQTVKVTQATGFPEQPGTRLTVNVAQSTAFGLHVRVPYWATNGVEAQINGKPLDLRAEPQSWATITRTWRDGDQLSITTPMRLHAAPISDDPSLVALMHGPSVLAGLVQEVTHFVGARDDLGSWLRPVRVGALEFGTRGQPQDVRFVPLCKVLHEPYGVYFEIAEPGSARAQRLEALAEERRRREARVVDRVRIGDRDSEAAHNLQGELTDAGTHAAGRWRHARPDGWFSYDLKVAPDAENILAVTYWGSDVPPREFDILADGRRIATQALDRNEPDELFEVEYPIPTELTAGRQTVTVRFQGHRGNTAGGIFGLEVLRASD